jgi:uncharacterized membrane protein
MSPLIVWPAVLGLSFFALGLFTYRHELFLPAGPVDRLALGPVLMAAALATFSGEHFTEAQDFSQLVPKWLPLRVPIVYFIGAALLAASLSFVVRRCIRWSGPLLAFTFASFVLLIYLPAAFAHPLKYVFWIFPFRESTFGLAAFSVFVYEARGDWTRSGRFALGARLYVAWVAIFYGALNILHPQFSPGVPDTKPASAWIPFPIPLSYFVGAVLVALGVAMLFRKTAVRAITGVGIFMTLLTLVLYVPDLFLVQGVAAMIVAINFVADTLLFAGAMFAVARALAASAPEGKTEIATA